MAVSMYIANKNIQKLELMFEERVMIELLLIDLDYLFNLSQENNTMTSTGTISIKKINQKSRLRQAAKSIHKRSFQVCSSS